MFLVQLSEGPFPSDLSPQERERESKSATGGANWCEFMAVLNHLTAAEMNYFSLSFMERSWSSSFRIVKKEVLYFSFCALLIEARAH